MAYLLHHGVGSVERKGEGSCRIGTTRVSVNRSEGFNGGGGFLTDGCNHSMRRTNALSLTLHSFFVFYAACKRKKQVWILARKDGHAAMAAVLTKRSRPSFLLGVSTHSLLQAFKLLTCQPPKDYIHVCVPVCGCVDFSCMYIDVLM